jgi:hypothetical protein
MSTRADIHPFEPSSQRWELVDLVRRIQVLTLELQELEKREQNTPELDTTPSNARSSSSAGDWQPSRDTPQLSGTPPRDPRTAR